MKTGPGYGMILCLGILIGILGTLHFGRQTVHDVKIRTVFLPDSLLFVEHLQDQVTIDSLRAEDTYHKDVWTAQKKHSQTVEDRARRLEALVVSMRDSLNDTVDNISAALDTSLVLRAENDSSSIRVTVHTMTAYDIGNDLFRDFRQEVTEAVVDYLRPQTTIHDTKVESYFSTTWAVVFTAVGALLAALFVHLVK